MADSFIFLKTWRTGLKTLPPADRVEAYDAIIDYALEGKPYEGDNVAIKMMLAMISSQIDEHNKRYQEKIQQCSNAANARWSKQKNNIENEQMRTDADASDSIREDAPNYNHNNNSNNNSNQDVNTKNKRKKFIKPTIEEIKEYCTEQGLNIDVEYFFNHYEANGWLAGRVPMKDWKATLRNWAAREKKNNAYGIYQRTGKNQRGETPVSDFDNATDADFKF